MYNKLIDLLARCTLLFLGGLASVAATRAGVEFRAHVIETSIPGGYRVLVIDINRDGHLDVIGLSGRGAELYWYENPNWERHVITAGMSRMISVAADDIDGDGIPELALATHFAQTDETSEGFVYHLHHQGDPRQPWKIIEFDRLPTSHRLVFADIDGDGKKELVNAALTGEGGRQPMFEGQTPLVFYRPDEWQRQMIYDRLDGVVHGLGAFDWDGKGRAAILTASFGGIWLHRATGKTSANLEWTHDQLTPGDPAARPKGGASEVRVGKLAGGKRFLATIEPWHGDQVVIYTRTGSSDAAWKRHVIDDSFEDGHAVELADFDGDGTDEVVAGFRGVASNTYLYTVADASGNEWTRHNLDAGGMAAAGCDIADINKDGRLDIVCIGARTANIKWYENLGAK